MVHLREALESEAAKAAAREGRSLDQFVSEAVEEKLRHARHVTTIHDRGAAAEEDEPETARP
ncbi:hypothetical protein [Azospirillum sp. sgz302134]